VGEQITLISYAPFDHPSVWTEVGPVYIHAARCDGYQPAGRLPGQLATGPRVLRTYRADDTMNYGQNTVVTDDTDLGPSIQRLLGERGDVSAPRPSLSSRNEPVSVLGAQRSADGQQEVSRAPTRRGATL